MINFQELDIVVSWMRQMGVTHLEHDGVVLTLGEPPRQESAPEKPPTKDEMMMAHEDRRARIDKILFGATGTNIPPRRPY